MTNTLPQVREWGSKDSPAVQATRELFHVALFRNKPTCHSSIFYPATQLHPSVEEPNLQCGLIFLRPDRSERCKYVRVLKNSEKSENLYLE